MFVVPCSLQNVVVFQDPLVGRDIQVLLIRWLLSWAETPDALFLILSGGIPQPLGVKRVIEVRHRPTPLPLQ